MHLIDTNVVSEARKRDKANPGVIGFFEQAQVNGDSLYVSVGDGGDPGGGDGGGDWDGGDFDGGDFGDF